MVIMERDHHRDSGTPENCACILTYKCQPKVVWTLRMRSVPTGWRIRPPEIEPDPCFTLTSCPYGDGGGVTDSQKEIDPPRQARYIMISLDVVYVRRGSP